MDVYNHVHDGKLSATAALATLFQLNYSTISIDSTTFIFAIFINGI